MSMLSDLSVLWFMQMVQKTWKMQQIRYILKNAAGSEIGEARPTSQLTAEGC
jgi:hypothetical protein